MRVIKYRGFSEECNEVVYGQHIYDFFEGKHYIVTNGGEKQFIENPSSIGQCTDLVDMNGNYIYEGDLLTSERYHFNGDSVGLVEWSKENATFYLTKVVVSGDGKVVRKGLGDVLTSYDLEEFSIF